MRTPNPVLRVGPGRLLALGLLAAGGIAASLILSITGPLKTPALATDTDTDGLSDDFENAFGTDPGDDDTDGDGLTDWDEIFIHGTNPLDVDTDGDTTNDDTDTDPLNMAGQDGNTTPTSTFSENLTAPALSGASPTDGFSNGEGGAGGQSCCSLEVSLSQDAFGYYPHSGDFTYRFTPLHVKAGYGPSIPMTFTYRQGASYDGLAGNSMFMPSQERLAVQGNGDVKLLFQSGPLAGIEGTFTTPGGGTPIAYVSPDYAPYLQLTKNTDNTFTLEDPNGNTREYGTNGKIVETTDRFGNGVTFAYTTGRVSSMTDASGHTVTITYYAGTNRVQTLADDDGRTATLIYNDKGQLAKWITPTSTEYPSGRATEFRYSNGSTDPTLNNNLIRIIDPRGNAWYQAEFDEDDRITRQVLSGSDYEMSYSGSVTSILDRNGNLREWTFSGALPTQLEQFSNRNVRAGDPASWVTTFDHNADGFLDEIVYPRGNRVDMTYDAAGAMTERRRKETDTPSTSGSDLVETWTYDAAFHMPTTFTDPMGNVTTYTLDTNDRVVETVTHETVTYLTPDQTVELDYTWSAEGQMTSSTDGEGTVTEYDYFTSGLRKGYLQTVTVDPGSSPHLALVTSYDYTNFGVRKAVTNPRGKTTTYTINEYGWTTKRESTSPQGYEVLYEYDANGNVDQMDVENVDKTNTRDTVNAWFTTTYQYDPMDRMTQKTEEIDMVATRTWQWQYGSGSLLLSIVKPEGNITRYSYDERDLVFETKRGYGTGAVSTDSKDYDANGNISVATDGRGKAWTNTYDLFDRRTKTVNPLGHYSESVYDKNGNATETKRYEEAGATDVLLAHTKHHFDEMNRMFKMEHGLKGASSWSWIAMTSFFDKRSRVLESEDGCGELTAFEYDASGRQVAKEDPLGNRVEYTLDSNGNVTQIDEIEETGHGSATTFVTEMAYDAVDRLEERRVVDQTNGSNKHVTSYLYTSLNILVEQEDPETNIQSWTHDGLGRVLTHVKTLASGNITRTWALDDNDRVVSHKDDSNNETTWAYNTRDLVTVETYPDSGTKTFTYDLTDNVTEWIDPNGTEVDLVYDDCGRNTSRAITRASGVLGTTSEAYVYDALDRMTEGQDNDVTVQLTWDSLGRKTSEVSGPNPISTYGKTTSYTYDDCGTVTGIAYPDGTFEVLRTLDDNHRATLIEDHNSADIVAVDYYGAGGRLKQLTHGNATTSSYNYDGFRWVSDVSHETSTPTEFAGFTMVRDDVGNILTEEWSHDSGKGNVYAYDLAYRLTKALIRNADPSAELTTPGSQTYFEKLEYNLNDDSSRTSLVTTPYGQSPVTANYTSNNVHEYTVVASVNRVYDTNGNLIDDGINDYAYDYRNQLVEVIRQSNSGVIGAYEYDALGRRTRKTLEDSSEIRFYHDDNHEIEEFDENDVLLRKYVYRQGIDSIAMMEAPDVADVDGDSNTSELKRFYYHYDGRANVARLTDPDEAVVESYETDPYGTVSIKDKNGGAVSMTQVGNPITFQRRRLDGETGLIYFRARQYVPSVGHWLQRDPLGFVPGPNWHEFMSSNPCNRVDPMGLADEHSDDASNANVSNSHTNAANLTGEAGAPETGAEMKDDIGYVSATDDPKIIPPGGSAVTKHGSLGYLGPEYIYYQRKKYGRRRICPCAGGRAGNTWQEFWYDAVHENEHEEDRDTSSDTGGENAAHGNTGKVFAKVAKFLGANPGLQLYCHCGCGQPLDMKKLKEDADYNAKRGEGSSGKK